MRFAVRMHGVRITASAASVQAALSGQGMALTRRAFVSDELRTGRLIRRRPQVRRRIPWAYCVVAPKEAAAREPVQFSIDWPAL